MGPGETADFELRPTKPGEWRLEITTAEPGWYIPLPVVVVPAGTPRWRTVLMALRHVLAILLLPTMVTVVVPRWILRAFASEDSRWPGGGWSWIPRTLGGLLILAGLALVTWCISLFVRVGKGTLAPWDPTSNLVAVGPYRYTRNPMITGVATILTGEALLFGSWRLALWAVTFIAFNHIHFLLVEEPGLERRFGESYVEYKRAVPRWFPRVRRRSAA